MHTEERASVLTYILLGVSILIFSCSSLCSKLASGHPLLSWEFILFYGMSILALGVYAVLWQMVLKRLPLSVAYSGKPISMLLSMTYGVVLFGEALTWNMILGAVMILCGIRVVMTEHG